MVEQLANLYQVKRIDETKRYNKSKGVIVQLLASVIFLLRTALAIAVAFIYQNSIYHFIHHKNLLANERQ